MLYFEWRMNNNKAILNAHNEFGLIWIFDKNNNNHIHISPYSRLGNQMGAKVFQWLILLKITYFLLSSRWNCRHIGICSRQVPDNYKANNQTKWYCSWWNRMPNVQPNVVTVLCSLCGPNDWVNIIFHFIFENFWYIQSNQEWTWRDCIFG